ncbi:MAG TPA: glutathione peroxidase [Burkholderiaceae bacterium]|jgi:glutathione peroxidase|nr:glutathione peroxidase [Burkholderiaceae bacterium]
MPSLSDFNARSLTGKPVALKAYAGRVLLIVNTASQCGFTPQYKGLQALQDKYHAQGLDVLGFPCNQFGSQEPGDAPEIGAFCERNYGVTFPMFEKVDVNGSDAHPLWQWLTSEAPGLLGLEAVKWNFTKFLIARDGTVFKRYAPQTDPAAIAADIETLLARE